MKMVHPGFRYVCPDCGEAVRKSEAVRHRRECEGPSTEALATEWLRFITNLPELEAQ